MYETIIIKIEERKLQIRNRLQTKYWGLEFDCGSDYAEDSYLNELFVKLEYFVFNEQKIVKKLSTNNEQIQKAYSLCN